MIDEMIKISNAGGSYLEEKGSIDSFQHLKELGYTAVDYRCFSTNCTTGLYLYDDKRFEEFLLMEKATAQKIGIDIVQAHGVWPFDDRIDELYDKKREAIIKSMKGLAILGVEYLVLHPCMPVGWSESPHHYEDVLSNIDYMRSLLPYAKEYGVKIALENMPDRRVPCGTVKELIDCIDEVDDEFFVACLDTGHCNISEDVGEMTRKLSDRLKCLHIHDNDGKKDLHWMPCCGGTINWDDFIQALRDIGYRGSMSLECFPPLKLPPKINKECNQWLKNVIEDMAKRVNVSY